MIYYNINNMGEYTNSEKLAQIKVESGDWAGYESTSEEIVMQGDGAGYCLASEYCEELTAVQDAKIQELKDARDAAEVEPITTELGVFDYDQKARERINAAIIALSLQDGATISWTLADNTEATVAADVLRGVVAAVAVRSNALHVKYRGLADQVRSATTAEAVKIIEW